MPRKMYFAKVPLGIMDDNRFKPLAKKKNGDSLLVTAFQLLRVVANTDGMYTYSGDEETIEEELAFLADRDADQVTEVINYLVRKNLAEMVDGEDGKTFMYTVANEFIGTETESAERMRRMRAKKNGTSEENSSQSDVSASQCYVIKKREEKETDKNRQEQTENDDVVTPPAEVWNVDEKVESIKQFFAKYPEEKKRYEKWYNEDIECYPKGKRQAEGFYHYSMLVKGRLNPLTGERFDSEKYSEWDMANIVADAINAYVAQNKENGTEERYYVNLVKFYDETIFDYVDFGAYDKKKALRQEIDQREKRIEAFKTACEEKGISILETKDKNSSSYRMDCYQLDEIIQKYGVDALANALTRALAGEEPDESCYDKYYAKNRISAVKDGRCELLELGNIASHWLPETV